MSDLMIGLLLVVVIFAAFIVPIGILVYNDATYDVAFVCPVGYSIVQDGGFGSHVTCMSNDERTFINPSRVRYPKGETP